MATKTEPRPGARLDAQPRKITTDYALNEVSPGSDAAAFSWLPADLERARARRDELGLHDDKARSQRESQAAELRLAERRLATEQANVEALRTAVAATSDEPAAKSTAKAAPAATAKSDTKADTKSDTKADTKSDASADDVKSKPDA